MEQIRAASGKPARSKLLKARSEAQPKDEEGKKKRAQESRQGYMNMYHAYCKQAAPEHPEVCSNPELKAAYAKHVTTT
ncbi:hypothetical protein AB1Y20_019496 [Prymnesium parvum]|uniref:Uncharacterized protein n=1 Tax=Prymnesium parvum TaxID=97485 RepID=A0AB34JUM6_PRYPA